MERDKLFTYVIIHHPNATRSDKDKNVKVRSVILAGPTQILAKEISEVNIIAARHIPETHLDKLDEVEIAVAPF